MLKESMTENAKAHAVDFAERMIRAGFTRLESITLLNGVIELFERENDFSDLSEGDIGAINGQMVKAFIDTFLDHGIEQ
jgi:DNA-binding ferritin-like protein (Dps family)